VVDGGSGVSGLTGGGSLREAQAVQAQAAQAQVAQPQAARTQTAAEVSLAAAAQAAHENFPVALRILPARYTTHLMALYGFARLTDDIGDEPLPGHPHATAADRIAVLDALEADVHRIYAGQTPQLEAIRALAKTVEACDVPEQPFTDLIEANRQDQRITRYADFEGLVQYCTLSANPVGLVVLHIFGVATPERIAASDNICTALQLAEHWQDVAEDLRNGRIYLPGEDLDRFGCTEADLARTTANEQVRDLLEFETKRAVQMLNEGAPLAGMLRHGPARLAIAGYVAGGRAALKAIGDGGYDVLRATPRPGKKDTLTGMIRCYVTGR
jgi:squalene synthase HpnC